MRRVLIGLGLFVAWLVKLALWPFVLIGGGAVAAVEAIERGEKRQKRALRRA